MCKTSWYFHFTQNQTTDLFIKGMFVAEEYANKSFTSLSPFFLTTMTWKRLKLSLKKLLKENKKEIPCTCFRGGWQHNHSRFKCSLWLKRTRGTLTKDWKLWILMRCLFHVTWIWFECFTFIDDDLVFLINNLLGYGYLLLESCLSI